MHIAARYLTSNERRLACTVNSSWNTTMLSVSKEMSNVRKYYDGDHDLRVLSISDAVGIVADYHLLMRIRYKPIHGFHLACLSENADSIEFFSNRHKNSLCREHMYSNYVLALLVHMKGIGDQLLSKVITEIYSRGDIELLKQVPRPRTIDQSDIKLLAGYKTKGTTYVKYFEDAVSYFMSLGITITPTNINFGRAICGSELYDPTRWCFSDIHAACCNGNLHVIKLLIHHITDPAQIESCVMAAGSYGGIDALLYVLDYQYATTGSHINLSSVIRISHTATEQIVKYIAKYINFNTDYKKLCDMYRYDCVSSGYITLLRYILDYAKINHPNDIPHILNLNISIINDHTHIRTMVDLAAEYNYDLIAENYRGADIATVLSSVTPEHLLYAHKMRYQITLYNRTRTYIVDERMHEECLRADYASGVVKNIIVFVL